MQKTRVKKVDPAFKNRLYLINNTITSVYKPLDWKNGGAASWNDFTENYIVDTKVRSDGTLTIRNFTTVAREE